MTSPLVPTGEMEIGGKVRTLRLDLNALTDFESMSGKSIMRGGLTDITKLEMSDVRALLWACLVQDDESLSIRDVGKWITLTNIAELTETFANLIMGAMPEKPADGEVPEEGPLPQTSPSVIANGGSDSTLQEPKTSD